MGSASRAVPCDARVCGKVSVYQVACVSLKGPFFKRLTKKRRLGLMGFEGTSLSLGWKHHIASSSFWRLMWCYF